MVIHLSGRIFFFGELLGFNKIGSTCISQEVV